MERKQGNGALESAISRLQGLSNESQAAVLSIVNRLAEVEGIHVGANHKLPIENIPHWLTKLRSERKSERTISLYEYCARRFLRQIPTPIRADVRDYLARRIEDTGLSL